jgi:hypothetical protein
MTDLGQALKSPHRVVVFEGGHTWLSSELATEAIEWMEIQAMSSGMRAPDQAVVDDVFKRRTTRADRLANGLARMREWQSIARDFRGLKNISELDQRAAALSAQADVKAALDAERADAEREHGMRAEVAALLEDVDTSSGVAKAAGAYQRAPQPITGGHRFIVSPDGAPCADQPPGCHRRHAPPGSEGTPGADPHTDTAVKTAAGQANRRPWRRSRTSPGHWQRRGCGVRAPLKRSFVTFLARPARTLCCVRGCPLHHGSGTERPSTRSKTARKAI